MYITSEEFDRYRCTHSLQSRFFIDYANSNLELLEETEELDLVLAHIAISWGLFLNNSNTNAN